MKKNKKLPEELAIGNERIRNLLDPNKNKFTANQEIIFDEIIADYRNITILVVNNNLNGIKMEVNLLLLGFMLTNSQTFIGDKKTREKFIAVLKEQRDICNELICAEIKLKGKKKG